MSEKFLCASCYADGRDTGIVELNAHLRCAVCDSDTVFTLARVAAILGSTEERVALFPRAPMRALLLEYFPDAAAWWDNWNYDVEDLWLTTWGQPLLTRITLEREDGTKRELMLEVKPLPKKHL